MDPFNESIREVMTTEKPDIRWKQRFSNYQKAFKQLESAVAVRNPDMLQSQGIIQCFEYTFELAWKTLQDYISYELGYSDIKGPRPVLQQCFQDSILSDGEIWFDMLKSRNLTAHLYDENEVKSIYTKIVQAYFVKFSDLHQFFLTKM